MTHVSQSVPKMRPRFAGVTFVAIGNGATDLSANITAIRNGDVLLSTGALTGAAMFVQCIVASEVMRASRGPVKCRGATLRDLGIFIASVVLVLTSFAYGRITHWFIVGAVLLYMTYAVWVFLGDEWHERGRPEAGTMWQNFRSSVLSRLRRRQPEDSLPWALMDLGAGDRASELLTAPLVPREVTDEEHREGRGREGVRGVGITSRPGSPAPQRLDRQPHHHHLVSAKAYQEMVWADFSQEARDAASLSGGGEVRRRRQQSRQRPSLRSTTATEASGVGLRAGDGGAGGGSQSQLVTLSSLNGSALTAPAPVDAVPPQPAPPRNGVSSATASLPMDPWVADRSVGGESDLTDEEGEDGVDAMDEEAGLLGHRHRRSSTEGLYGTYSMGEEEEEDEAGELAVCHQGGRGGGHQRTWWNRLRYELTVGTSAEWEEIPPGSLRRRWRSATFPLLLPVYAALRFSIPFVDPASYSRRWLVVTCVGAPLLAAVYLAGSSWLAIVLALATGASLAAGVAYFTAGEEDALPDWDFGTSFAFGPAFFAVFGFVMGIIWIDILASQVVGLISLLASLLRLPSSVMGLTLLAWGNSLGDFFGNPAMARRGKPTMALTACFAGPLFNMLTSMALGFGSYFVRRRVSHVDVELRPEVALGCGFLVLYNMAVAAAGLMNHGSLPERFYVFARGWYLIYLAAACVMGMWKGQA
ncbi:hypothetical protein VaNZ11_012853 [Volvox africanus]|uniref:Sodium/calcium exchanger membrane region domain-containing protein n=1 Tax=Volvox africanus TaxID=51714 RepID=A0ABQ5SGI2_9CHLO|nr:hypothetical protein VaNZ11_012853 [Volvox africanus]